MLHVCGSSWLQRLPHFPQNPKWATQLLKVSLSKAKAWIPLTISSTDLISYLANLGIDYLQFITLHGQTSIFQTWLLWVPIKYPLGLPLFDACLLTQSPTISNFFHILWDFKVARFNSVTMLSFVICATFFTNFTYVPIGIFSRLLLLLLLLLLYVFYLIGNKVIIIIMFIISLLVIQLADL